jgi:hypothetical protein
MRGMLPAFPLVSRAGIALETPSAYLVSIRSAFALAMTRHVAMKRSITSRSDRSTRKVGLCSVAAEHEDRVQRFVPDRYQVCLLHEGPLILQPTRTSRAPGGFLHHSARTIRPLPRHGGPLQTDLP